MGLLFVAGRKLILDAGHQIVVVGAADRPLDNIQPPGRIQLDLEEEGNHVTISVLFDLFDHVNYLKKNHHVQFDIQRKLLF